jgi:acetoin utilization deacetylase AcuC-like enzyme
MFNQALTDLKKSEYCDTSFSAGTLHAARRAAGAVAHAVDRVMLGRNRNAFCCVRPPGHHAGYNGLLSNAKSCGFCIFNSIAAGALHALESHQCERVAIVDLDVHHGNGTEDIVKRYSQPDRLFFFSLHLYDKEEAIGYEFFPGSGNKDDTRQNIINVPITPMWHGPPPTSNAAAAAAAAAVSNSSGSKSSKDKKGTKRRGSSTGASTSALSSSSSAAAAGVAAAVSGGMPSNASSNSDLSSLASTTGASAGGSSATTCVTADGTTEKGSPTNAGSNYNPQYPQLGGNTNPQQQQQHSPGGRPLTGREAYRQAVSDRLLPSLRAFNPSLVLISAGFDPASGDVGNTRTLTGVNSVMEAGMDMQPADFAWTSSEIMKVADLCCNGRVVSVLEGGYGQYAAPREAFYPLSKKLTRSTATSQEATEEEQVRILSHCSSYLSCCS